MSAYSTDDYEFSFAKRTLQNLHFIQKRVQTERAQGLQDYQIKDAFEVTQLLNSFIGLLVIPRQKCFDYMPDDMDFPADSEAKQISDRIVSDPARFEDTYYVKVKNKDGKWVRTNQIEKLSPKLLALRLRNAISHDHLIIQPQSLGEMGVITGVEFSDKPTRKREAKKEYFRILLNIHETEVLVEALCKMLLSCYPDH